MKNKNPLALIKCGIDKFLIFILITVLISMTVLVVYQVVVRYLFNSPSAISEVLSRYLFIWLILLGGAYVFGLREHMAIFYLRDKAPQILQLIFEMVSELIIIAFATSVMIIGGYQASMRQMWQIDSALQIPMGIIYLVIPISGCLIVFYGIYNEIVVVKNLIQYRKELRNSN